jgi:HK97 family phage major capsid protein
MKEKLLKLLAAKEARKQELNTRSNASTDLVEVRSIGIEIDAINIEIAEFRSMIDAIPAEVPPTPPAESPVTELPPEQRGIVLPQGAFNPLGTYGVGAAPGQAPHARSVDFETMSREDLLSAPEYRSAYLKNMQHKQLNEVEQRALTTAAGSGGAAVPTITYDKIIEKLRQTSVLFPLIGATYLPGNVTLPVANARTAALWTAEAADAVFGDDTVAGVVLSGYTLAKFAKISIAAMVMTIDAFETYIVKQITEQLAIAVENAILNGVGTTQPTGILPGVTWDSTNSLTYAASGLVYDDFVGIRALLKTMYRVGAMWVFNSNMEAAMMKIKTSTGKPIFTQDPANGFISKILNIPYVVDDYMPDNTILLGRLDYYFMNFSQSPVIEASRDAGFSSSSVLYRGLLVADGKPALSEAFVRLTMGS